MTDSPDQPDGTTPLLLVVKGDPTPEEVAALVSVVAAMAAGAQAAGGQRRPRPEWGAPHRKVRGAHRHGPGAWRVAGR